jgi:hypothetical protein
MESLLKFISAVIPFIGRCPLWMQFLAVAWVAFTAILIGAALICALIVPARTPASVTLTILKPEPAALVTAIASVEFTSPHWNSKHYVLVVPQQAPVYWIVDGPITVTSNEHYFGHARCGDSLAGRGEQFSLQILSTDRQLRQGTIDQLPADAKLSAPVLVQRAR